MLCYARLGYARLVCWCGCTCACEYELLYKGVEIGSTSPFRPPPLHALPQESIESPRIAQDILLLTILTDKDEVERTSALVFLEAWRSDVVA